MVDNQRQNLISGKLLDFQLLDIYSPAPDPIPMNIHVYLSKYFGCVYFSRNSDEFGRLTTSTWR